MSASVSTRDVQFAAPRTLPWLICAHRAWPGEWARSMARRASDALRTRHRKRRARAAFDDAYEVLHRLDQRVLLDIGIRPDQLTAFARAATASSVRGGNSGEDTF